MESVKKVLIVTTLTLNEQERIWLQGKLQTPGDPSIRETASDKAFREKFFEALSSPAQGQGDLYEKP